MLELKNIDHCFRTKSNHILFQLSRINIKFPDKGMFLIYGKSGSGKSTILNIITGKLKPERGIIKYNNTPYDAFTKKEKESLFTLEITTVPQDIELIEELTIKDNINFFLKLANKDVSQEKIAIELENLDIDPSFLYKYPRELSSGEKQRIALLRCVLLDSNVLVVDEPTSRVDEENTKKLFAYLKKIADNGKLVIVASHDTDEIQEFIDGSIEIEDGEIVQNTLNFENYKTDKKFVPKKLNLIHLLKLPFINLKYKCSKFVGFSIATILSLLISFISINITNTNYIEASNEFILNSHPELGINIVDKDITNFDDIMMDKFGDNWIKVYTDYRKNSSVIPSTNRNIDYMNISLIKGYYPKSENQFAVSDTTVLQYLHNKHDDNYKNYTLEDVPNEFENFKREMIKAYPDYTLTGLYQKNDGYFETVYVDDYSNFASDFIQAFATYSTYNSVLVGSNSTCLTKLESNYSIKINSKNDYNYYLNFIKNNLGIDSINPFKEIYTSSEKEIRKPFDIIFASVGAFFIAVAFILTISYCSTLYSNHKKEYKALVDLGLNKNKTGFVYTFEAFLYLLFNSIVAFAFMFLGNYLVSLVTPFTFNYNLPIACYDNYSLLYAFGFILFGLIVSFVTNRIKRKSISKE